MYTAYLITNGKSGDGRLYTCWLDYGFQKTRNPKESIHFCRQSDAELIASENENEDAWGIEEWGFDIGADKRCHCFGVPEAANP
jgi:hypothetical protein